MDNILRDHISRSRLCPKNKGQRCGRLLSSLDFQIFMNNIKGIHLLTLIFMQPLYLNIENGIRVQDNTFRLFHISCQFFFLFELNLSQPVEYRLVIGKFQQFFQLIRILLITVPYRFGQETG